MVSVKSVIVVGVVAVIAGLVVLPTPVSFFIHRYYTTYVFPARMDFFMDISDKTQTAFVLRAALKIGIFDYLAASGPQTVAQIAAGLAARNGESAAYSVRAMRVLCNNLVVSYFLDAAAGSGSGDQDGDKPTLFSNSYLASQHLVRPSASAGGDKGEALDPFLMTGPMNLFLGPGMLQPLEKLPEVLKLGKPAHQPYVENPDDPFWQDFAQDTISFMSTPATSMAKLAPVAELFQRRNGTAVRVLDVAAGSGCYGFQFAQHHPTAQVTLLDWPSVLAKARKNMRRFFPALEPRVSFLEGSAFDVPLPDSSFDVILVSHFYHHFNHHDNLKLTRAFAKALKPGGLIVVNEFMTPAEYPRPWHNPFAWRFSMVMLVTTEEGDAYSVAEYQRLIAEGGLVFDGTYSGFPTPMTFAVAHKPESS